MIERQRVEIGDVVDELAVDELLDERLAEVIDVHREASREVEDLRFDLLGALRVRAARRSLALDCDDFARRTPGTSPAS